MKQLLCLLLFSFLFTRLCGQTTYTWIGATSTSWATETNWTIDTPPTVVNPATPPTIDDYVIIPGDAPIMPTLSNIATCRQITVQSGATLNGGTGGKLTIQSYLDPDGIFNEPGLFIVESGGTFTYGTSNIVLISKSYLDDANVTVDGVKNFWNLTISGATESDVAAITGSGDVNVYSNLLFTKGILRFNTSDKFIVGGSIIHSGASSYSSFGDLVMKGTLASMPTYGWRLQGPPSPNYINANIVVELNKPTTDSVVVYNNNLFAKSLTVKAGKFSTNPKITTQRYYTVDLGNSSTQGSLTIDNGAKAFISNTLTIYTGNLTVNGQLNVGYNSQSPAISLTSGSGGASGSATINGTFSLFNSSTITAAGGSLSGSGTINANGSTITIGKYFDFSGTFNAGTSTVAFVSSNESRIANNRQFYNLTFNKTNTGDIIRPVTLDNIVSFTNNLNFTSGYFYRGGLRAVKTNITTMSIPNFCAITLAAAGNVTITKFTQSFPPGATENAIKNYLVVSGVNQNINTVSTWYQAGGNNNEFNTGYNNSAGNLKTWRSINSGTSWTKIGGSDDGESATSAASAGLAGNTTYFAFMDDNSSSLPVEFDSTYFFAAAIENGIELKWRTHSEENLKGFVVYRSTEAHGVYTEIDSWVTNSQLCSKNDGYSTNDTDYNYVDTKTADGTTYYYRIKAYCSEIDQEFHPKTVSATFSGMNLSGLDQNFPNPFNSQTTIRYTVGSELPISLAIYNTNGQTVKELVSGVHKKGVYAVSLNSSELASGMYFYKLKVGNQTFIKKMMAVK